MAEYKRITCIVCPLSCEGEVAVENAVVISVRGYSCRRGEKYAGEEAVAPRRMLTATVRVTGGELPLLPVVSAAPLPKAAVLACARRLAGLTVAAPVREGEVVCADILGLGVDIVASRDIGAAGER